MSIERFLLVNLVMDAALMAVVARSCGTFSPARVLLGAALASAYAAVAAARPLPWAGIPFRIAALTAMAGLCAGRANPRLFRIEALLLAAGALLAGGAAALFPALARPTVAGNGAALLGLMLYSELLRRRHPLRAGCWMNIALRGRERTVRFEALIDTGNHLREPVSGLPVLIAEERLVRDILPDSDGRRVPYGGLGGNGWLTCFRPAEAWTERGSRRAALPGIWVGVFPGRLPGPASALAPCEFASLSL